MKKGKLLITEYNGYPISLLIDAEGKTVRINTETAEKQSLVGNIYAGNVTDIVKGINAAFVEFGEGQRGFLQLGGKSEPIYLNRKRKAGPIRQGDIILVQVSGDAMKMKDVILSTKISIAGKYAVLVVGMEGLRFSSRLNNDSLRSQMSELYETMSGGYGFIIRTASENADTDLILKDMDRLGREWETILESAANKKKGLVYEMPPFYITDVISAAADIGEVVTDDTGCFLNVKQMLKERYPEDMKMLKAYNRNRASLKTVYGVMGRIDEAMGRIVRLKSGAFLVIEPTEALVAVDVNSGKAVKPDFLKINLEAAKEAARQIRLRNLSGMIVVDFISMRSKEDNETLLQAMKEFLDTDPLKPKAVDITALGLLEITRKKVRRPLYEILEI